MSMAPQELEDSASRYATDAIRQDSQGARGMAVSNYAKGHTNHFNPVVPLVRSVYSEFSLLFGYRVMSFTSESMAF